MCCSVEEYLAKVLVFQAEDGAYCGLQRWWLGEKLVL